MTGALVVGLGCRPGVRAADVRALVQNLLDRHGLSRAAVRAYATLDSRAAEPGLRAVAGAALLSYPARVLARVPVPNPNARVLAAVGTPAVAEAAAIHAAAVLAPPDSVVDLVGEKLAGLGVTAAVARISAGVNERM